MGGKGYKPRKDYAGRTVSGDWEDSDRGAGNKATRRAGGTVKAKSPTYLAHVHNKGKKKVDPKKNPAVVTENEAMLAAGKAVGKTIGTVTGGLVGGLAGGFPGAAIGAASGNVVGGKLAPGKPEKKTIVKVKKEEVEVVSEVAGTVVKQGGKELLKKQLKKKVVRQGIKVAGKTGGRAAQGGISGGMKGTVSAVKDKKAGKGEKIGKVVGGLAGGLAGGAAGAPIGGVGAIATGIAGGEVGERIGGAIGKKFDKKKKPTVKKESYSDWRTELEVKEAKVDKGRSDYGKATIRNYRRSGPGHGEPAMFDSENKRGKTIDKRREEHKARRGVKGAKVPAYKLGEEGYDRMRDDRLVKYGIGHDGSDRKGSTSRPTGKQPKGKTVLQKETEKKYGKGVTALDIVKKDIENKHGKGAIMSTKKK